MSYPGSEISFRVYIILKHFNLYVQPNEEGRRLVGQNVIVANFQSSITFTVYIYKHTSIYCVVENLNSQLKYQDNIYTKII